MTSRFKGVFTALVTPFKNSQVDFESLSRLVKQQTEGGVSGFVINGTTAESPTLTQDEVEKIFNHVRDLVGTDFPLVIGTGTNSTVSTIINTQKAETLGADAALVVCPYYNKPPQEGLRQHFVKVAESTKLPILLYNVPGRTVVRIENQTLNQLAAIPNIIGVKDATGDIDFGRKTISENPEFLVTSGDDPTCMNLAAAGGGGVISVISHLIPAKITDLMARAMKQDASIEEEYAKWMNLVKGIYIDANPIPVKYALFKMGVIESAEVRLPLCGLSEEHQRVLDEILKQNELLS